MSDRRVGPSAQLLRRRVCVLAGELVADDRRGARIGILRDAVVDNDGLGRIAAAQDDVVGRKVTVDDVALVCRHQSLRHATRKYQKILRRHPAFAQHLIEPDTFDVIHHQVDMAVLAAVVLGIADHRVVADVPDLLLPVHQDEIVVVLRELGVQNLQRHNPARDLAPGAIDLRCSAATEDRLDPIGVVEHVAGLEDVIRQGSCHSLAPLSMAGRSAQLNAWNSTLRFSSPMGLAAL